MVNQENRSPSFTKGNNVTVPEDAGSVLLNNWAINISDGDNEIQLLTFNITGNSNPDLFSTQPAINSEGTLTFVLAENAFGDADIKITLSDDGNVNTTSNKSNFSINVTPVNDQPQINAISDITIDAGISGNIDLSGINSGAFNESQNLAISVTTDRPDIISELEVNYSSPQETGSISFVTLGNVTVSPTITVTVSDNGDNTSGGFGETTISFTVNVNEVITNELFLPSLFSPNNDGNNDNFIVRGGGLE